MQWLTKKYAETPLAHRFYIASMTTILLGLITSLYFGDPAINVTNIISSSLIVIGFIIWCFPAIKWLRAVWDKPFAKTPIVFFHILALLASTAISRFVVSIAFGLPPQSFDLTVGILVLIFYIPALMAISAAMLFLFGNMLLVFGVALGLLQALLPLLKSIGLKNLPKYNATMPIFHSFGAMAVGFILLGGYALLTDANQPWFLSTVRNIALVCDFQPAVNYPDVKPGERVHPLENGYIAYAYLGSDRSIVIGVRSQSTDKYEKLLTNPI